MRSSVSDAPRLVLPRHADAFTQWVRDPDRKARPVTLFFLLFPNPFVFFVLFVVSELPFSDSRHLKSGINLELMKSGMILHRSSPPTGSADGAWRRFHPSFMDREAMPLPCFRHS